MVFPEERLRRLRMKEGLRRLVRETRLNSECLVMPLFVRTGQKSRRPIPSMPGQFQLSPDKVVAECRNIASHGLGGVLLFGIPDSKDETASRAYADDGIIPRCVRLLKREIPQLIVITDVCLCEYMSHGHCGVVKANPKSQIPKGNQEGTLHASRFTSYNYYIDNDATLDLLAKMAVAHARAGADMVAPSDMMDGRVRVIRKALDMDGFIDLPIMSYAVKYASSFYGPFRDAAESPPQFGDRRSYQMDPPNAQESLREVALDIDEGADIIMVKPALAYGDIIRRVKDTFHMPVAAYNVSGEYAMVKAAVANGWLSEREVVMEMLTCLKRAGADVIITYWAQDAVQWLESAQNFL
jgi:porphobilinogen synthase